MKEGVRRKEQSRRMGTPEPAGSAHGDARTTPEHASEEAAPSDVGSDEQLLYAVKFRRSA